MKGFRNIGNTCYLNAGLQMLVQNKDLAELISKYSSHSQILKIISDFIQEYYDVNTSDVVIPNEIKKIVQEKQDIFSGFQQQDSTEFIIYLLDIIDEEIKQIDKSSNGIKPLFGIIFNSRIKCKLRTCLTISNNKELNNFLLLDINSDCTSLDDAYRQFKSGELLTEDNKYFCGKCQDKRVASKRTEIETWPKYLFVWLKRYKQVGHRITKNSQQINIPLEWRHNTSLQGAVVHDGGLNGGHYIYVGKQENNKWYIFNDSHVSEISDELLNNYISRAYWLYYKNND